MATINILLKNEVPKSVLKQYKKKSTPKKEAVIELLKLGEYNLSAIARAVGLTRERVRQIKAECPFTTQIDGKLQKRVDRIEKHVLKLREKPHLTYENILASVKNEFGVQTSISTIQAIVVGATNV